MQTIDNRHLRQRRIDAAYQAGLACSRDRPYCPYQTEYEITAWRLGFDNPEPKQILKLLEESIDG